MKAGTTLLINHHVDKVLMDDKQAIGVTISPPQNGAFYADIIVLADGSNSMLAKQAGIATPATAGNLALFAKETIALSGDIIEKRFNLLPGHGSIIGLIGYPTAGLNGTGSIHTFKESVNINVGITLEKFAQSKIQPYDLIKRLKKHPYLQLLLEDGKELEFGSVMIPEGGYNAIPQTVYPGLILIGDAAGLVNGTHGLHLAMWSGYFAAQAAKAAKLSGIFSAEKLSLYRTLLNESFIMQDLKANRGIAKMEKDVPYMFDLYSRMANEAAYQVAKIYIMPKKAKRVYIFRKLTSMQPLRKMVKDAWKIFRVALG